MNLRRSNVAVALILTAVSGWLLLETNKLVFGTMRAPQTAFFPKVLAWLLLLSSLGFLLQSLRAPSSLRTSEKIDSEGWKRIAATLATLIGFAFVLERLGFFLSTFVLMVLLLRAVEPRRWPNVIAIASATSLTAYLIFGWLLSIPLPGGILGF